MTAPGQKSLQDEPDQLSAETIGRLRNAWSVRDGLGVRMEWFRELSAALEAAGRPDPAP